jgi:ribonucleotide reductase beta subunit family protein with ferritin-like domain
MFNEDYISPPSTPFSYDDIEIESNSEMDLESIENHHNEILSRNFTEPILQDNCNRFSLYPIKYDNIWKLYKQSRASNWEVEEIDLINDLRDWDKLTNNEKKFLKHILAFFATADGVINENLSINFSNEVQIPEIRAFYAFQQSIEVVHQEAYSLLLQTYVKNENERLYLFNAIRNVEGVKRKAQWALKWINSKISFETRLFAFALVECVFFSASFCSIFWFKSKNLLPGLYQANKLISRDEALHVTHAAEVYKLLKNKLSQEQAIEIVKSAVEIEEFFINEALPNDLLGMNSKEMLKYIKFCADYLLFEFGYQKYYLVDNPFEFMTSISITYKENFFEHQVTSYTKNGVGGNQIDCHKLVFDDEDF